MLFHWYDALPGEEHPAGHYRGQSVSVGIGEEHPFCRQGVEMRSFYPAVPGTTEVIGPESVGDYHNQVEFIFGFHEGE
jgi:hypothetical protein